METLLNSLAVKRRHNLQILFKFTTVIPFKWSTKYICFYCDESFSESEHFSFRKHTKFHGLSFPDLSAVEKYVKNNEHVPIDVSDLTCELCNFNFENIDQLITHLGQEHDLDYVKNVNIHLDPYRLSNLNCLTCDFTTASFKYLKDHVSENHPNIQCVCKICGQVFVSDEFLNTHSLNYHSPGEYSCDKCPQTFYSNDGCVYHKDLVHDSLCDICFKTFPTLNAKEKHVASHSTKFKCFSCLKYFNSKIKLKAHSKKCYVLKDANVEIVLDEKDIIKNMRTNMHNVLNMSTLLPFKWYMNKYRCFYCTLDFDDIELLKEHSITNHTYCDIKSLRRCKGEQGELKVDISSLVCKECSFVVDNTDQIIKHLIAEHKFEYDKGAGTSFLEFKLNKAEIMCPFCKEQFTFFGNVLKHINDKHFQKNFICTYCGLYFCKEVNLRGHIANKHNVGLQCNHCSLLLPNKSKLILHMANMHGTKVSKCNLCAESFTNPYIRAKHMVERHNVEFKCKYCTKVFIKNSILKNHVKKNHPEHIDDNEAATSSIVQDSVKKEVELEDESDMDYSLLSVQQSLHKANYLDATEIPYVRQHSNKMSRRKFNIQLVLNMSTALPFKWFLSSFRCFYCSKNFHDPVDLKEHCSSSHSNIDLMKALKRYKGEHIGVKVDITALSCKICSFPAGDLNTLIDHLTLQHNANYDRTLTDCFVQFRLIKDNMVCLICNQKFAFFGHLLIHCNEQHQTKEHICSYCGLTFSKFVNLRAHISNRHKENSHFCSECDATFQTKPRLLTHMARHHGTKVSKCRECLESFTSPYLRSKHMVDKHNLEYKCPHCDKVFPKNSIMKTHIRRVHLRERNVQCDVCSEKFFDNVLLRLHMVKHEGVRNFKCEFCGKAFLWLKNLKAHMKAHSKEFVQNPC